MLTRRQWKACANRLNMLCLAATVSPANDRVEYALNAVNQGVTSLGIKGSVSTHPSVFYSTLILAKRPMVSSLPLKRNHPRRSSILLRSPRSLSLLQTLAWFTAAWVLIIAFSWTKPAKSPTLATSEYTTNIHPLGFLSRMLLE